MGQRVLVTGATGQVGSSTIARLLEEDGVEVVAAVRTPAKAAGFAERGRAPARLGNLIARHRGKFAY